MHISSLTVSELASMNRVSVELQYQGRLRVIHRKQQHGPASPDIDLEGPDWDSGMHCG